MAPALNSYFFLSLAASLVVSSLPVQNSSVASLPAYNISASSLHGHNHSVFSACFGLAAKYPLLTFLKGSDLYINETAENWSETCILSPDCIFGPQKAQDVAGAIKILRATNTKFAIRSGGHMPVPGAASIENGVLISMRDMNTTKLTNDGKTAQIGPGLRWGAVYDWISTYGLAVVGGRYNPVGVSGLLLGGGINYFGSEHGWSANMVSNYQVVLADGSIVDANTNSHSDLFWALKGGSSNFGIVTRFDLKTFPLTAISGGTTGYEPNALDEYVQAIASYVSLGGGSDDPRASVNPTIQFSPETGILFPFSITSYRGSDTAPAAFANFTKIPIQSTDVAVYSKLSGFTASTSTFGARTSRQLFYATSLKATPEAVFLANKTFFAAVADPQLKKISGLDLRATFQTITKTWLEAAQAAGGDAIDLDPANGNFIEFLVSSNWENAADDQTVIDYSAKLIATLNEKANAAGFSYPFIYVNDAAAGQTVFQNYGGGKSLKKLKAIRRTYDPSGVFQTQVPGGFKLGL